MVREPQARSRAARRTSGGKRPRALRIIALLALLVVLLALPLYVQEFSRSSTALFHVVW